MHCQPKETRASVFAAQVHLQLLLTHQTSGTPGMLCPGPPLPSLQVSQTATSHFQAFVVLAERVCLGFTDKGVCAAVVSNQ